MSFQHQCPVKFFLKKGMRDHFLRRHILDIGMTGAVQKIMASESKEIGKELLIVLFAHDRHSPLKKRSRFFLMHTDTRCGYLWFQHVIKQDIRSMKTDPVQINISLNDHLHLLRKFVIDFFAK